MTARGTDVEIEQLDMDFRSDFETRFAGRGYKYEHKQAAYQFGHQLSRDSRFHGRSSEQCEPEARRLFEEKNPGRWGRVQGRDPECL